jgi:disulfide oxidoreductase YuzD
MVIPTWIGTLTLNGFETNRIKEYLKKYLKSKYPEKLKEFEETPVDLLNSESEQILDLLNDSELLKDKVILILKNESNDITKFMYAVFFSLPLMLILIVFLILE